MYSMGLHRAEYAKVMKAHDVHLAWDDLWKMDETREKCGFSPNSLCDESILKTLANLNKNTATKVYPDDDAHESLIERNRNIGIKFVDFGKAMGKGDYDSAFSLAENAFSSAPPPLGDRDRVRTTDNAREKADKMARWFGDMLIDDAWKEVEWIRKMREEMGMTWRLACGHENRIILDILGRNIVCANALTYHMRFDGTPVTDQMEMGV